MTHRLLAFVPLTLLALVLLMCIASRPVTLTDFTSPCFVLAYDDIRCMGVRVKACKAERGMNTDWCTREVGG